jgi:prepilin-type N-terminal cleavage/methylation domain-containing protein
MKKGFTLIELLAVIVILAIIALIATPIVLNIINDTKESATLRSANFYLDAVEYAISTSILKGNLIEDGTYDILENGNICIGKFENDVCKGEILEIKVNGQKPNGDKITIKDGQIVSHVIKFGDVIVKNEDSGPEKNQYGFYYNVTYVAESEYGKFAVVFYEDNTMFYFNDVTMQQQAGFDSAALFYTGGASFTYEEATRTATDVNDDIYVFSEDGSSLVCDGVTFVAMGEAHGIYYGADGYEYVSKNGVTVGFANNGVALVVDDDITQSVRDIEWLAKEYNGHNDDCEILVSMDGETVLMGSISGIEIFERVKKSTVTEVELMPGLYEAGAISLYEEFGAKAIQDMLIMSWDNLVANGYITVTDGALYHTPTSLASPIATYDAATCGFDGDLILSQKGNITAFSEEAFIWCEHLESIVIPKDVTDIGTAAFEGCKNLSRIFFEGTIAQWNAITKGENWNLKVPATEVVCSDGTVPLN